MSRHPYLAHLCVYDPAGFALGFALARLYARHGPAGEVARIHGAISASTGRPWPETACRAGLPATAEGEGFALGVYGAAALP